MPLLYIYFFVEHRNNFLFLFLFKLLKSNSCCCQFMCMKMYKNMKNSISDLVYKPNYIQKKV